jgi:hypothetical protein
VVRQADLELTEDGSLEGQVNVTYTGLEALRIRLGQRFADDTLRKEYLEEELKNVIPVTAEVELKKQPDWTRSDEKLVAEYEVKIPGWTTPDGRRAVLPLGIFAVAQKHIFELAQRTYAVYFSFLFQTDETKIALPAGWEVESLPKDVHVDAKAAEYLIHAEGRKASQRNQRGQTKVMAAGGRRASQRWRSPRGAASSMVERTCWERS